ncbi:DUF2948 family protein [Mesorhizobium sp. BAC0120]|uniref:DUF2948 family protein n=1 Tax=Mesorhizobium sp. BAC0120 TaxID=3090670 RepID=UPI00298C2457|nr:DUF2948 family protein [Mesorhizobium sp. BAC0120]MDW6025747.1 DUF2948 family protein [Mesorhizobium sp. BAC0120]
MTMLKLQALDQDDLAVISAHVQDAVMKVEGLDYSLPTKRFVLTMNRFAWEAASGRLLRNNDERHQSVLSFARVLSAKAHGIDPKKKDVVLSLLAIRFTPAEPPAGTIELVFSGEGAIRLEVECIEASLVDTGGAWRASSRPTHRI